MLNKTEDSQMDFSLRAPQLSDLQAVVDLHNECSRQLDAKDEITAAEMANFWETPDISLQDDLRLAQASDGRLLGYVEALTYGDPGSNPYIHIRVLPAAAQAGVAAALMDWALARCEQVLARVPAELRVCISLHQLSTDEAMPAVLSERGFQLVRHSFFMGVDLNQQIPAPHWPQNVELRPFKLETDAEPVYRALVDAFKDHYGFLEEPFEQGFPRWKHAMIEDEEAYISELWFIAWEDDQIAGIALCKELPEDGKKIGWVEDLGVRRAWRKRGLGKALLLQSFQAFEQRGLSSAGLFVDASNLTGALRLYEGAGMRMRRQYDRYEKELRPGKEVRTTELTA
ncbi:MAG: GNAT family N-acetyltransferase [Enhydrobacter sp.]|nr:GNAT family N-acetyltransferase [Enhydrobacter sp.]